MNNYWAGHWKWLLQWVLVQQKSYTDQQLEEINEHGNTKNIFFNVISTEPGHLRVKYLKSCQVIGSIAEKV